MVGIDEIAYPVKLWEVRSATDLSKDRSFFDYLSAIVLDWVKFKIESFEILR
jgi:hypothetical protein